jgi:hypothetical protein
MLEFSKLQIVRVPVGAQELGGVVGKYPDKIFGNTLAF